MQNTAKFARNLTKYMTKPEFLVTKEKMLVSLATVTVAISSPVFSFYYTHHCIYFFCILCVVLTLLKPQCNNAIAVAKTICYWTGLWFSKSKLNQCSSHLYYRGILTDISKRWKFWGGYITIFIFHDMRDSNDHFTSKCREQWVLLKT